MLKGFSGCVRTVTMKKTDSDGVQSTEQIEFPVEVSAISKSHNVPLN